MENEEVEELTNLPYHFMGCLCPQCQERLGKEFWEEQNDKRKVV